MRILTNHAALTSGESGFLVMSAASFGFAPEREAWFRYSDSVYYEQGVIAQYRNDPASLPKVGWWDGWLTVEEVSDEEARGMGESILRALRWYREFPGQAPRMIDPFPVWNWEWFEGAVRNLHYLKALEALAPFLAEGAFSVGVRRLPEYAVVLARGGAHKPEAWESDPALLLSTNWAPPEPQPEPKRAPDEPVLPGF